MENFFTLDKYLGDFLRRTGRAVPPEGREPELFTGEELRRAEGQHVAAVAMTPYGHVESLMRAAHGPRSTGGRRVRAPQPAVQHRGDALRDTAKRLPGHTDHRHVWCAADLCLNPAILPHHRLERQRCPSLGIPEMDPKLRWITAHNFLDRVAPVRDLARDYDRFVAEICEAMRWTPLPLVNSAALRHTATEPADVITRRYRESLLIREAEPYGFSDFDVVLGRQPASRDHSAYLPAHGQCVRRRPGADAP